MSAFITALAGFVAMTLSVVCLAVLIWPEVGYIHTIRRWLETRSNKPERAEGEEGSRE